MPPLPSLIGISKGKDPQIAELRCKHFRPASYLMIAGINAPDTAAKITALVVPALLSGVAITVLIQRIKEIKKGEDDDLSKY